jgi:hypothetical protein
MLNRLGHVIRSAELIIFIDCVLSDFFPHFGMMRYAITICDVFSQVTLPFLLLRLVWSKRLADLSITFCVHNRSGSTIYI